MSRLLRPPSDIYMGAAIFISFASHEKPSTARDPGSLSLKGT